MSFTKEQLSKIETQAEKVDVAFTAFMKAFPIKETQNLFYQLSQLTDLVNDPKNANEVPNSVYENTIIQQSEKLSSFIRSTIEDAFYMDDQKEKSLDSIIRYAHAQKSILDLNNAN